MAILLYHEDTTDAQVALSEGSVAGDPTPARYYAHAGHFLEIDGPDHVVRHDVAQMLGIPGYRLATADEQDRYTASKKKTTRVVEKKDKE